MLKIKEIIENLKDLGRGQEDDVCLRLEKIIDEINDIYGKINEETIKKCGSQENIDKLCNETEKNILRNLGLPKDWYMARAKGEDIVFYSRKPTFGGRWDCFAEGWDAWFPNIFKHLFQFGDYYCYKISDLLGEEI